MHSHNNTHAHTVDKRGHCAGTAGAASSHKAAQLGWPPAWRTGATRTLGQHASELTPEARLAPAGRHAGRCITCARQEPHGWPAAVQFALVGPKRITHKAALSHGLHADSSTKLHTRYTHNDGSFKPTHCSRGADATEAQHTSCHAALSKHPSLRSPASCSPYATP